MIKLQMPKDNATYLQEQGRSCVKLERSTFCGTLDQIKVGSTRWCAMLESFNMKSSACCSFFYRFSVEPEGQERCSPQCLRGFRAEQGLQSHQDPCDWQQGDFKHRVVIFCWRFGNFGVGFGYPKRKHFVAPWNVPHIFAWTIYWK